MCSSLPPPSLLCLGGIGVFPWGGGLATSDPGSSEHLTLTEAQKTEEVTSFLWKSLQLLSFEVRERFLSFPLSLGLDFISFPLKCRRVCS